MKKLHTIRRKCKNEKVFMRCRIVADGSISDCLRKQDEGKKDDGKASESKADVVMITDVGTIDDKSFNQGTWEGVKAYGEETGKKLSTSNRQRNQTMPTRKLSIRLLTNTKRRLS